jgi:amino acid adenylation domain-containing protein
VLAPRSCQTIVAFLGILKANLAYLPLDVNVPAARIEVVLSAVPGHKLVLLGEDVPLPDIQRGDVELVRIGETLGGIGLEDATEGGIEPAATSLAYVIFTSGSTGKPKGVMIEHRSIVRLVKESNVFSELPGAPRIAHLTNLVFDNSAWEIYATLLNGGVLICIDYFTVIDSKALEAVFKRQQIRAALLPPALLKECLVNTPTIFEGLDALFALGDRFDKRDAIQAHASVKGSVYNAYGPTENAVISTIYKVGDNESFVNGVPIGRSISNSAAYIMDAHQQLVSVGVIGELVVAGDGLARGYTDPARDVDRFVQVMVDGQRVRMYRTGDRVRYRPSDGQIEFFGRMDQQVKIRGHRIEPAEVEHAMLRHSALRDAAVAVRRPQGQEPEMIGFVTAWEDDSNEEHSAGDDTANHLKGRG